MSEQFDVVVVGGGVAGLCAAGTLVLAGRRVCLVAETPEVGWNTRALTVGGNTLFKQFPQYSSAWGGGWWYPVVRALDIPLRFRPTVGIQVMGPEGPPVNMPMGASASGVVAILEMLAPFPLDDIRDQLRSILSEGLALDWRDLCRMSNVPLHQWLAERKAGEMVQALLYGLFTNGAMMSMETSQQHASVFGLFALLRVWMLAEGHVVGIMPDPQRGMLMPMAGAIEARGGVVSRGRKLAHVLIENDRATGVVLEDGTQIDAKAVAVATATRRVPAILPQMPDDVATAVSYAAGVTGFRDGYAYVVLDQPVVPFETFCSAFDETFQLQAFMYALHSMAPWTVEPGNQAVFLQRGMPEKEFEAVGGTQGVADQLLKFAAARFPGFAEATVHTGSGSSDHLWIEHFTHGPKLPRRTDDIAGLWFVGDGSGHPVYGIGFEAAAGAGVVGGREILEDLAR